MLPDVGMWTQEGAAKGRKGRAATSPEKQELARPGPGHLSGPRGAQGDVGDLQEGA